MFNDNSIDVKSNEIPERVALDLMIRLSTREELVRRPIIELTTQEELDLYAKCLAAVKGKRIVEKMQGL